MALAFPAGALAEDEHSKVELPAGSAAVQKGELHAGAVGESVRVEVELEDDPGDAALRVSLPIDLARVGGTPRLAESANGRVDLDDAGRTVTLDLGAARAGDTAELAIGTRGVPAGDYDLPLRWVRPDGTSHAEGELHVEIEAGERERERPDWNRVGEVRV